MFLQVQARNWWLTWGIHQNFMYMVGKWLHFLHKLAEDNNWFLAFCFCVIVHMHKNVMCILKWDNFGGLMWCKFQVIDARCKKTLECRGMRRKSWFCAASSSVWWIFIFFLFSGNSSQNPPSLTACAPALSALLHLIALVLLHKGLVTRRHVWLWLMDMNLTEKRRCPCPISVILWDFFREAGCYVWCLSLSLKNHGFPVRAPTLPQDSAAWLAG